MKNQLWDDGACACVCKAQECQGNLQQDTDTCDCKCPMRTCPDGYVWDLNSCSCQCSADTSCSAGQQWDGTRCKCVGTCAPLAPCQAGSYWNPETCACTASCFRQVCPLGAIWNPTLCGCGLTFTSGAPITLLTCSGRCALGSTLDLSSCLCARSMSLVGGCIITACPLGMNFDISTCDCRFPSQSVFVTAQPEIIRPFFPVIRPVLPLRRIIG